MIKAELEPLIGEEIEMDEAVGKFMTGEVEIKGKRVKVEVEVTGVDNKKRIYHAKILFPKKHFGLDLNIPAKVMHRGKWVKTKTGKAFEEVKVESVLKYELNPKEIRTLKKMRDDVIKKNPGMKPIDDNHLHVTLASGPGWKKLRSEYEGATFSDPDFRIDFEEPKRAESGNSVSWYAKAKQQKQFKEFVTDLLQSDPDPKRVFHVSLANKTGKVGDSVATV